MSQRLTKNFSNSMYELRGASPVEGEGEGTGSSAGTDTPSTSDGSGTEGSGTEEDGAASTGTAGGEEDLDTVRNRMKAADRRASAAEKELKDLRDAQLSETEKKDKELEELRAFRPEAEKVIANLEAKVAFLSINDVAWHDPAIALSQIDFSTVTDEDGKIDNAELKKAVKKLAEGKSYLVKTSTGESGGGAGEGQGAGASGGGVGSGKGGSKKGGALSDEELRQRYPALYV